MPGLQKTDTVGIFLHDRELAGVIASQPWEVFAYDFQKHEQEITQVGLVLRNKLN